MPLPEQGRSFRRHRMQACLSWLLIIPALSGFVAGAAAWLVPIEVVQGWALERAADDEFRRFEALGQAEFLCWMMRIAGPMVCLAACLVWRRAKPWSDWLGDAIGGLSRVTHIEPSGWRTVLWRGLLVAWSLLAAVHFGDALRQRMRDWPYYKFRSGAQVLPNISDSNREVIRYLRLATPETARILVVSDQKLFFLSYYLLPRRLYHRMHPDSEHVIPKEHLQRPLAAYSLADLDEATLKRINPDYILEYFEHPAHVDRSQLLADESWIGFLRRSHRDPKLIPGYLVRLRRVEAGGTP